MNVDDLMFRRVGSGWRVGLFFLPLVVAYLAAMIGEIFGARSFRAKIQVAAIILFFGYMGFLMILVCLRMFESFSHRGHVDGYCDFCGYDLRATPERCSECGAEAPSHEPGRRT